MLDTMKPLAVAIVTLALLAPIDASAETREPHWAVFAPDLTRDSAGVSLAQLFRVDARSVCLFRADSPFPKLLPLKSAHLVTGALANAQAGLIAATVILAPPSTGKSSHTNYAVIVLDTLGNEAAMIAGARDADWAPDGQRLAVWYSTSDAELAYGDSAGVWDVERRRLQTWKSRCVSAGWLTSEILLLNHLGESDALNLRTGAVARRARRGAIASPDTTYALRENHERGPEVLHELLNVDLTDQVESLLDGGDLRFTSRPFWVRDINAPHHLCFNSCRYRNSRVNPTSGPPECDVYLIDVKEMRVLRTFPGRGIGPTADGHGVVILRGRDVRFTDLAALPREEAGVRWISFCPSPSVDMSSWKLVDKRRITLRLPKEFVEVQLRGIDSWVGEFRMPDSSVVLSFDWGIHSSPITRTDPDGQAPFDSCEEVIGGKRARLVWAPIINPGPDGARILLGYRARAIWRNVAPGSDLTLLGSARDWHGLEVLLASIRTFQFK